MAGSADARYQFTAKERDANETGYDYFGARYYDSWRGGWTSVDPMAEKYPDVSPYQYSHNNPVSRLDIDGLSDLEFDAKTGTLTLYDKNGKEVGHWDAGNKVASDASGTLPNGMENGTYEFKDTDAPYKHGDQEDVPDDGNKKDDENGSFGPNGIFRLKDFKDSGGITMRTLAYMPVGRTRVLTQKLKDVSVLRMTPWSKLSKHQKTIH